jgi:hypothetical protein
MKIIKIATINKTCLLISMSTSEWLGLSKISARNIKEKNIKEITEEEIDVPQKEIKEPPIVMPTIDEFESRLRSIGWDLSRKGDTDYMALAPDKRTKLTIPSHNFDLRWRENRKDLIRQNPDLKFLYYGGVFEIPENFDIKTQKLLKPPKPVRRFLNMTLPPMQLPADTDKFYQIKNLEGNWEEIGEVELDFQNNKAVILTKNGNILEIPSIQQPITIRKEIP